MHKFYNWFTQLLIVNLFVTIVSLPILVAWGLPLSWLSPIGNLIFTPFLSLFLLLAAIAFFIALIGISHTPLNWVLEWLNWSWYKLLGIAPDQSFVGFSTTALSLICIISCATFFLIMLPQFRAPRARIALLTALFFSSITMLKALQPGQISDCIICKNKPVIILKQNGTTVLIDIGAFAERSSPSSWVQYHLIPELIQKTGSTSVDHLIITRPTIRSFEAAAALMKHSSVLSIYYPEIKGSMTGSHRGAFKKWYAIAKEKKVRIQCVKEKPIEIAVGDTKVMIEAGKKVKYREIEYSSINAHFA